MLRRSPQRVLADLGRRVAELRVARDVTQEGLAERLGCSPRKVQRLEAGEANLSIKGVAKLALALDVDAIELFETPSKQAQAASGPPGPLVTARNLSRPE